MGVWKLNSGPFTRILNVLNYLAVTPVPRDILKNRGTKEELIQ